jgi:hypothetical protein
MLEGFFSAFNKPITKKRKSKKSDEWKSEVAKGAGGAATNFALHKGEKYLAKRFAIGAIERAPLLL